MSGSNESRELSLLRKEVADLRKVLKIKDKELAKLKYQVGKPGLDALTGLAGRNALLEHLNGIEKKHRCKPELSLMIIDIDRFKSINDTIGHQAGDAILKQFTDLLRDSASLTEMVARIGGDQFLLLMREPIIIAFNLAEMIRTQTESNDFRVDNKQIRITVSIGVAEIREGETIEELIAKADRCVYAAKSDGRNRVVTDSDLSASVEETGDDVILADLENRIRVMTDRLARYLVIRSRNIANHYKNEASKDGLTGIYNRGYLDRLIDRELKKAKLHARSLSVAMVDLDDFGQINKNYNWTGGDHAIKTVAGVVQGQIRANDWVARYGGDEILIVMPDTELSTAEMVAERIRKTLEDTLVPVSTKAFHVTASIGVAKYDPQTMDLQALYGAVGDAARQAKKDGKNRVVTKLW